MNFIKKNKFTIIAIILFILLVVVGVEVKNFLVPDEGKAVYGDRLDGIKDHPLSDDTLKGIATSLKENEKVVEVSSKLHGKIINIIITVTADVSVNDAKTLASSVSAMFKDSELSFYSLQVYVKKEDASLNNFPIIGYQDAGSKNMLFTKDREITVGDTNEE